jgi:hypothetical protein
MGGREPPEAALQLLSADAGGNDAAIVGETALSGMLVTAGVESEHIDEHFVMGRDTVKTALKAAQEAPSSAPSPAIQPEAILTSLRGKQEAAGPLESGSEGRILSTVEDLIEDTREERTTNDRLAGQATGVGSGTVGMYLGTVEELGRDRIIDTPMSYYMRVPRLKILRVADPSIAQRTISKSSKTRMPTSCSSTNSRAHPSSARSLGRAKLVRTCQGNDRAPGYAGSNPADRGGADDHGHPPATVRRLGITEQLEVDGGNTEAIDPVWLSSFPWEPVVNSVARTGRLAIARESAHASCNAEVRFGQGELHDDLQAPAKRVASEDVDAVYAADGSGCLLRSMSWKSRSTVPWCNCQPLRQESTWQKRSRCPGSVRP